jgi:hypothetical protein
VIDGAQLGLEIVLEDPSDEGRNRRSSVAISWQVACNQRRTHVLGSDVVSMCMHSEAHSRVWEALHEPRVERQ